MQPETLEFIKYILRFLALFFVVGAVTLDLVYLFRFAHRDARFQFSALSLLKQRELTMPVVLLTLFTALIFTVPGQLKVPSHKVIPGITDMVSGSLVYAFSALLLMMYAAYHGKTRFVSLFHSPGCSLKKAVGKGLLYGVAAIPPTMLVTLVTNNMIVRAGFESESQSVIQWLTDPSSSILSRVVILVSAVIVAPFAEETIFRGILFPAVLKRKSWFFSAMLTGCMFSLIHFHPPSFLSIYLLSLFFCAGYSVTGSLITPIIMHMVFNASATFFTLLV